MFHYALHNYDFPGIFFMFLAIYYFLKSDDLFSSVFLSIGTATKLFPALLLPLMLMKRKEKALIFLRNFFLVWLGMNLPAMIMHFPDWAFCYIWQAGRAPPACESLGYWSYAYLGKWGSLFLFVLFYLGALFYFYRARRGNDREDSPREFLLQAGSLLGIFFVFNKIYSPQYMLWLLPFFVFIPHLSYPLFWFLDTGNVIVNFCHFKLLEPRWMWVNALLTVLRTVFIPYIFIKGFLVGRGAPQGRAQPG
jgi:hypothetical protein